MSMRKFLKVLTDKINEYEEIEQTLENYINERVEERMGPRLKEITIKIVEEIHKKHQIPLKFIVRELPELEICRGVITKRNGEQKCCQFKPNRGSNFCRHHINGGEILEQRELPNTIQHTHGDDIMYVEGCPGCMELDNSEEELRGLIP